MKHIGFNSRLLLLFAFLLAACSPASATRVAESRTPMVVPLPSIQYAPTAAPPDTMPPPTQTHDPRTPTLLPQELREATMTARATASPFPTARVVTVKSGAPASATAQRDGLSFAVELPKDSFLEGENGRAQITLRNDGRETLMIHGDGHHPAQVLLLDERGHEPAPYPWFSFPISSGPPYMRKLAPGQVLTATMSFQLPPSEQAANHNYVLWAWTRFSRLTPDNPDEADRIGLRLETGPIPLHLAAPDPSQQLIAHLQADRKGWQLRVTDARGQAPNHPLRGALKTATSNILQSGGLEDNAQGEWSAAWDLPMAEARIVVQAWIAAPGYAIAAITQTVSGGDNGRTPLDAPPAPPKVFTSRESAQAELGFPLYAPETLPPNAALDHVEVETIDYDHNRLTNTTQSYRVGRSGWFELMQVNSTDPSESAGWGRACCDSEAERVTVNGTTGYLVKQFDWWVLDWKVGNVGFELHAPAQVISREQLLNIAQSVQP
jgi:hypothetical protein